MVDSQVAVDRHQYEPLLLNDGRSSGLCAACGQSANSDTHVLLVDKLLKRADQLCPPDWSASAYWYGTGGGRQQRHDAELLREAAAYISRLESSDHG